MAKSTFQSYVEAGAQFTEMSRQQADAFVKFLVKSGDVRRRDAEQMVQTMLSRSRQTTDRISALVQAEVGKQLKALSERFEDVEGRLESLASSLKEGIAGAAGGMMGGTSATADSTARADTAATEAIGTEASPPKTSTTKKSGTKKSGSHKAGSNKSAKKSGAKKSGAKKAGSKKPGAKKSGVKKSGSKKAGSKRSASDAVGTSGVRKVSTTRPATASE